MGHQSYVLLCTETTLSNPPVVQPKSSCDVHILRSPWSMAKKAANKIFFRFYEGSKITKIWFSKSFFYVEISIIILKILHIFRFKRFLRKLHKFDKISKLIVCFVSKFQIISSNFGKPNVVSGFLRLQHKFDKILLLIWILLSERQIQWKISSNFWGLFRKLQLSENIFY